MIRYLRKAIEYINDPSRSFRERVYILLTLVADVVAIFAFIGDVILKENKVEIITLAITIIFVPIATLVAVKKNKIGTAAWFIVVGVVFILLPILFFFGGGLEGGGVLWILFAYLYIGLILTGIGRTVMIGILTLETVVFYMIAYYHPEYFTSHSRSMYYMDSVISLILVGLVSCLMVAFEEWLYRGENEKAKAETRKVEELNRSQNRFFSSMSHEIRTPINSILGLNEIILRQDDASEEIIRDSANIQGAGRMLLALINDILDFSKIEAGKMDIVPINYRVSELLSEIVNMMLLRAQQKGLELKVEVDPSIPAELYGDEVRIKQILVNLLNNAVKYTQEGSVTLRIDKEDTRGDQILLLFSVSDTGMGIKQDAIPYLFDAFQRADEEKNIRIEGTGLGLSIVKQLVDLMDGRITVNSVYSQGSTFTVTLWQRVTRADAIGDLDISGYGSLTGAGRHKTGYTAPDARILIVDDSMLNLEVEKRLLKDTEINVDTAKSGVQALSKTVTTRYDVILMDHLMPGMDGIECLQRIRIQENGLNNHVPVIVLTANAGSENQELYNRSGFDGYLVKPVSGAQLEEAILEHLPQSKVRLSTDAESRDMQMNIAGSYSRKIPILIATGSSCDLDREVMNSAHIDMVPFNICADDGTWRDTIETTTDEILRYMRQGMHFGYETPSIYELEDFFGRELKKAHSVIYIASSSQISNEFDNASEASQAYGNVWVFDSELSSAGVGMMALIASRLVARGRTPERIIDELTIIRDRIRFNFVADGAFFTLRRDSADRYHLYQYLNTLGIRPYIGIKNGRYRVERITLGEMKRNYEKYIDHVFRGFKRPDPDLLIIVHTGLTGEELDSIKEYVVRRTKFRTIICQKASGVTALDFGPGSFGLIYMEDTGESHNLGAAFASYEEEFAELGSDREETDGQGEAGQAEPDSLDGHSRYENIPGIDYETAIEYSGSEEIFGEVLQDYYKSVDSTREELNAYYSNEDWDGYVIKIHALKSTSRLIGAISLGDEASALESAGTAGDIAYIKANHDRVMDDYLRLRDTLAPLFVEDVRA